MMRKTLWLGLLQGGLTAATSTLRQHGSGLVAEHQVERNARQRNASFAPPPLALAGPAVLKAIVCRRRSGGRAGDGCGGRLPGPGAGRRRVLSFC